MRRLRRWVNRVESAQIRVTGSSLMSIMFRTSTLLLETVGRRTGIRRVTPLAYALDDGGGFVIVGGAAGQSATPDWVANLRAHERARITVDRHQIPVLAEELHGTARRVAWKRLARRWPRIERYAQRADRTVPVFVLHRITEPG